MKKEEKEKSSVPTVAIGFTVGLAILGVFAALSWNANQGSKNVCQTSQAAQNYKFYQYNNNIKSCLFSNDGKSVDEIETVDSRWNPSSTYKPEDQTDKKIDILKGLMKIQKAIENNNTP